MLNWLLNIDTDIFRIINNGMQNSLFDWLMPLVTSLGNGGAVWLAAGLMFLLFRRRQDGVRGFLLLVLVLVSSFLLSDLLKDIFQRPRPFVGLPDVRLLIPPEESFSFPSGHATTSIACASLIYRIWARAGKWFLAIAVGIAFSRVYVGVHYPLDVLGGALLGYLCAMFVLKIESSAALSKYLPWRRDLKM